VSEARPNETLVNRKENVMAKIKSRVPLRTKHAEMSPSADDEWDDPLTRFIEGGEDADATTLTTSEQAQLIDKFASKITALWYRSTESICQAAAACAEIARQLSPDGKKLLLKKLPFGVSTFSKLVRIGNDPRIYKIIKKLPPSYSKIYLVSQLSDEQLKVGIEKGVVNAGAGRKDIENFRDAGRPATKVGAPSEPKRLPAAKNKARDSAKRSARKTSDPPDGLDEPLEDDEEFPDDDRDSPEPSESDEAYDALVAEWKAKGLHRTKWQATPEIMRQRFIKEVLCREPFRPPLTATKTTW
jgi:hypothetical protein